MDTTPQASPNKRPAAQDTVTVIVPTLNAIQTLPLLLESFAAQTDSDFELTFVDGGSTDGTYDYLRKNGFRVLSGGNRSQSRNAGAREAVGGLLLFVDSDMIAARSLVADCKEVLSRFDAACIAERVIGADYWSRCKALESSSSAGVPLLEAARAFRGPVFRELGGYDELCRNVEDIDLQVRLLNSGFSVGHLGEGLSHNPGPQGFWHYVSRRRSQDIQRFRVKHPKEWATMSSPFYRARAVIRWIANAGQPSLLLYLPGLSVLRMAELVGRLGSN